MSKKKSALIISVSVLPAVFVLISLFWMGSFKISSCSLDGIPGTYSVESALLRISGRSKLNLFFSTRVKEIDALPYIADCRIESKGRTLTLLGDTVREAVIITDKKNYYFYSDSLIPLDKRDVNTLKDEYTLLYVEPALLEEFLFYDFGQDEKAMINTLKELKSQFGLITTAEYDNNNSSVFSGSLLVKLPSYNAILVLEDIRYCSRIGEALKIIERQYIKSNDRVNSGVSEYRISQNLLIKMR